MVHLLFVAKINDSLLGLSTVRVGLGTTGAFVGIASTERSSSTLFFTGIGTGTFHSFKSNYISLTGTVDRNLPVVLMEHPDSVAECFQQAHCAVCGAVIHNNDFTMHIGLG